MRPRANVIGERHAMLIVVADVPIRPGDKREVVARCEGCGFTVVVRLDNLRRKQTRACSDCARKRSAA